MSRTSVFVLLLLMLGLVVNGVAVVYVKHQSRALFVQLQATRTAHQTAMMEWKNQQLELATVGSLDEVSRQAQERLKMRIPQASNVVVIN